MPLPLLIGSNNPGKLSEIHDLLADLLPQVRWQRGESLFLPQDLGLDLDVVEDGHTYAENAARKALAFCQPSAMITLADDSGLEVAALEGAPGLHSARFAPPDLPAGQPLTSPIRRAYLLRRLAETGAPAPGPRALCARWPWRFRPLIPARKSPCPTMWAAARAKSSPKSAGRAALATTPSSCCPKRA